MILMSNRAEIEREIQFNELNSSTSTRRVYVVFFLRSENFCNEMFKFCEIEKPESLFDLSF